MEKSMRLTKKTQVKKWGNGSGILLPKVILDMLSIKTDDPVEISVEEQSIVISPIKKQALSLAERFASYDGDTTQEEYWMDEAIGKEIL